MLSLYAFEIQASQIPTSYIPALLTVTGTLLAAAFTSVIAQYLFAPALDARKHRLLDRSMAAAATVDTLREMQLGLELIQMTRFRLRESFGLEQHRAQFNERALAFDAVLSLAHSGLPQKYTDLALRTQLTAEIFTMLDEPTESQVKATLKLLTHTIGALDPANLPWTRAIHWMQGQKVEVLLAPSTREVLRGGRLRRS